MSGLRSSTSDSLPTWRVPGSSEQMAQGPDIRLTVGDNGRSKYRTSRLYCICITYFDTNKACIFSPLLILHSENKQHPFASTASEAHCVYCAVGTRSYIRRMKVGRQRVASLRPGTATSAICGIMFCCRQLCVFWYVNKAYHITWVCGQWQVCLCRDICK